MKSKNIKKTYNIGKLIAIAVALVFLTFAANGTKAQTLDQCNPATNPACDWQNGNLKGLKEGDSAPYRFYYSGLTSGNSYTATIDYGTTKAGNRAQDYLTTYNKSFPDADPCQPTSLCSGSPTTYPIPTDPDVTSACPGCVQGGNFTIWGGTITAAPASSFTLDGAYTGDSTRHVTITFTANSPNVLIAFGGHISSRVEWGFSTPTCATIAGSPYHVSINNGPNRSMKVSAIFFPGLIKVTKAVAGRISVSGSASEYTTATDAFSFTSTNNEIAGFSLTDNYNNCSAYADEVACAAANPNPIASQYIQPSPAAPGQTSASDWMIFTLNNVASPGASGTISEVDNSGVTGLVQAGLVCSLGVGSPGTVDASSGSVVFSGFVQGSSATCTFINNRGLVTAATAVVTGKVTAGGKGVKGATVVAQNFNGVQTVSVKTDAKGNYKFTGLETTDGYTFTASAQGYTLTATGTSTFFPLGSSQTVNFTGTAAASTKGGKNK